MMKSILFAILLFFSTSAFAEESGPLVLQAPIYCQAPLGIASFVLKEYDHMTSKPDLITKFDEMAKDPNVAPEAVVFAKELIDLVYAVQPMSREEFAAVYQIVIDRCVYEEAMRQKDNDIRL